MTNETSRRRRSEAASTDVVEEQLHDDELVFDEDGLAQYGRRAEWYELHPGYHPRVLREIAALEARLAEFKAIPL